MMRVVPHLLERQVELEMLGTAVERTVTGRGSVVLVSGEAGIGKTSLVHAFLAAAAGRARVLAGTCEDLLTPRALGPLRDAARSAPDGPLAAALSPRADPDLVFAAACDELASPPSPAMLAVEDAHWADGATLDVLRYLGTRVRDLPAVLLMTYRDDALTRDHPLRGVLGVLGSAAATRLRLTRLTSDAVREMAASTDIDPGELFQLTGGNPFYVTEVLANPSVVVPPTVVDAVLARVRTLSPPAQAALDRLAVIPSGAEVSLLRVLAGDLAPVAEAERAGVVEVRGDVVAFRHELARRAVAESLPASVRLELNADVLRALLTRSDRDPFRVLHHAVGAGDDAAVITHGQEAAQEAARVGAHRQAAACYAQVLARGDQLTAARRAALGEAYAWALSNSHQLHSAATAAATSAELWRQDGDDRRLVRALVTLARQQWLIERTAAALASAERAIELARPLGDSYQEAIATLALGGLLVVVDREEEGLPYLNEALGIAERCGAASVAALCRNYLGSALLQLGDRSGCGELLRCMAQATSLGDHEHVMRAYYNLIEGLWRLGEYREALGYIEQAESYGRDRDFRLHGYMFAARRYRLALMRGQWAQAEAGLRELLDGQDDPGMIGRETIPILARVLVRQGSADAAEWLALAARHAARADVLGWLVPAGLAHIEHAG
ncbi:MAG TPA: AAA family ATPase [Streptosporangiaceae bacterium]